MLLQRMDGYIALVALVSVVAMQMGLCRAAATNDDFTDYKIQALGETGTLYCNSTESNQAMAIPPFYEPIAWMLPNLSRIDQNNESKYELQDNNWTLVVPNTVLEDLGVYHCMLLNDSHSGNYYLVKVGLNAEGPYFFDMWEKYMWPTIIGICCFFGFLLLAALSVILFHFRYIPPKKDDDDDDDDDESKSESDAKSEGDAVKVIALTDNGTDGITPGTLPPVYNGNSLHTYENPSFHKEAGSSDVGSESDDEDLTSF